MTRPLFSPAPKVDRVLVVDDLPDNCFLIQALLQEEGYQIDVANNGSSALAYIEQSPPDLVLLDVMMPGMDGYEVTRRIRQNTSLPFMPILLITAHERPSVVQGLDIGADEFIRKPVEYDELVARVRSLLRLKHSVDERDQIARQREDFVSRLTHDLRTPLVAADRMLTLFQQGALGELAPSMDEAVSIMIRSNQNLLTMVNMLLEVYRYEAGRKTLAFAPVNLGELLQEVVQELSPIAQDKSLKLELEQPEPVTVKGDRLELRRVFTNLIGNAIKFTDAGAVTVRLKPQDEPEGGAIAIEDTGAGISLEDQQHLFQSFSQGNHRKGGSGLGLQLSRRIVEAHQGKIEVSSEVGKGSVFTIQLPATQT
jgi:two-component system, sensor histidine kinase and response regulator